MVSQHEIFVRTYEHRYFFDIFPIGSVIIFISLFGLFGNLNIVVASLRKKSLRSNCNILIASAAFADIFHQLGHFILGYHLFTGRTFITLPNCFWLQILPVFWMNFGSFVVLSIGLDRLFSVLFPLIYKQLNSTYYLIFMMFWPTAFGVWMTTIAYFSVLENYHAKVICLLAESYHVPAKDQWLHTVLVINIMIILVYSAVWIVVKVKNDGKVDKRIICSLTVIMFLVIGGWFTAALGVSICLALGWDEEGIFKSQMYIGTLINLSISLNWPVYMYFCKTYKVAFLEQLQLLRCQKPRIQSHVFTMSQSHVHKPKPLSTTNRVSDISMG